MCSSFLLSLRGLPKAQLDFFFLPPLLRWPAVMMTVFFSFYD